MTAGVRLEDATELKVVTGIDDHSRVCVSARLVPRATARPSCESSGRLTPALWRPRRDLTNDGEVFTGRFGPRKLRKTPLVNRGVFLSACNQL